MPAGAARNAVDCALWDLEAKTLGVPAYRIAGLDRLAPGGHRLYDLRRLPAEMARAALRHAEKPILKLKLSGSGDAERIAAVRAASPFSELIVDANEACAADELGALFGACQAAGVALIEQPLPAGQDGLLGEIERPVPVCADESVHTPADLAELRGLYDAVNIKLDETGGLTGALHMIREAQRLGFAIMIGSMVGTSLAMAPALLLAPFARWVDLDGPLLLEQDRNPGLTIARLRHPPARKRVMGIAERGPLFHDRGLEHTNQRRVRGLG